MQTLIVIIHKGGGEYSNPLLDKCILHGLYLNLALFLKIKTGERQK